MTIRRALSCRAPAARGIRELHVAQKIAFFDIGVDIIVFERERIIRQQQEAIRELSTPVLQIRERLLQSIRVNRARVVVMDVTGAASIDSNVANHLLQTVTAARLMGAHVIMSGLSPRSQSRSSRSASSSRS